MAKASNKGQGLQDMQVIHFLKLAFVTLTVLACNPVLVLAVFPQAMALESWPLPGEPGFPLNAFYGKFDEKTYKSICLLLSYPALLGHLALFFRQVQGRRSGRAEELPHPGVKSLKLSPTLQSKLFLYYCFAFQSPHVTFAQCTVYTE